MNPYASSTITGATLRKGGHTNQAIDTARDAPVIELRDLAFGWPGEPALLDILHLSVRRGERVLLSGPSGCGKSTLLGLIGGVLKPSRGSARIDGTEIHSLSASRTDRFRGDHIGFIFQQFNLLPWLSVYENVSLPLRFSPARRERLKGTAPRAEAQRLLTALGLQGPELQRRRANELSIGQQQRVAAARALIGRPRVLVADEPTSALDEDTRSTFLQLLIDECAQTGTAVLFVSHELSLAPRFDRHVRLSDINVAPNAAH